MGRQVGDFPLEALKEYKPKLIYKPADFKQFWEKQRIEISTTSPKVSVEWRDYPVPTVDVADIAFESWDGTPIDGLLIKPKSFEQGPVIINHHGYTGSCGLPIDYLKWTSLGVAVYSFDVRGQGTSPDFAQYVHGSRTPGWMLQGIHDPANYYYTNVYKDLLMQTNWIRSGNAPVTLTKLGLTGSSQGGGLALSLAALAGDIDLVIADYPFIANFERALEVENLGPYMEIINYFKLSDPQYKSYENVMRTLGYIDSVHFCDAITCPTLMTIGLEDAVTPPSTAFAVYNHLASTEKRIEVYPQFTHENNPFHEENKLSFIMEHLVNAI